MTSREQRKVEHLKYAVALPDGPLSTWFANVGVMHNCLPELECRDIDLSVRLGQLCLCRPLLIDAITGGGKLPEAINRQLAIVAHETGTAMAVGSQYGTVKEQSSAESYRVVRAENPDGVVFANVSALANVAQAQEAVDMLEAQALEIHLNAAQELVMQEGDRSFKGYLKNIENICHSLSVPVIAKETGCGMAAKEVRALTNVGVAIFDIGGAGGTNFPAIEAVRANSGDEDLVYWGIPTVLSLIDTVSVVGVDGGVIASGGVRSAEDCFKALALGANMAAMSGNVLRLLQSEGIEKCCERIEFIYERLRNYMLLTGCRTTGELTKVPLYFTGDLYQALQSMGVDLVCLSRKR